MRAARGHLSLTRCVVGAVVVLVAAGGAAPGLAQPPLAQMAGIPLPDPALPDGTVTVRVVRGAITNNVAGQTVELRQGEVVQTAVTDDSGRATFVGSAPGEDAQATTVLDSQLLQSQLFPVPRMGGVRVILATTDAEAPPVEPARPGSVSFGEESWIQIELVEESIEAYFFLDIVNPGEAPVEPGEPLVVNMPSGAQGTTVLRSSSPRAVADGPRVEIAGPFAPGSTPLHFAYILPYSGESLVFSQTFPVDLTNLLVSVEQWGNVDFVSPDIERRVEVPGEGPNATPYLLGGGPPIPAGSAFSLELVGLPHRSRLPGQVTVVLALAILGVGAWGAWGTPQRSQAADRRRTLEMKREALFSELITVERQHHSGKIGETKHASRRSELLLALERVYRELDDELVTVQVTSTPAAAETTAPLGRQSAG